MKNCPDCSAILDDGAVSCPYCGSDKPALMDSSQMFSMDDKTAMLRAKIAIVIAVIALVINPIFITTLIASNVSEKVRKKCNPSNERVIKLCTIAMKLAGIAIVTSPIIFFAWFINAVVG